MSFFSRLFGNDKKGDVQCSAVVAKNRLLLERRRAELSGVEKRLLNVISEVLPENRKLAGSSFDIDVGERDGEIKIVFNADVAERTEKNTAEELRLPLAASGNAKKTARKKKTPEKTCAVA